MTASSILVLGAGELGMAVLRELAAQATPRHTRIAALLRPASLQSPWAETLRELGVELLAGDLQHDSQSTLAQQFSAFTTVICCTGFAAGPGTQCKLARAAIEAGVQRFVPWQFGVDYDVIGRGSPQDTFDEQLDVRELLRSQHGTQWLIISTGMFTSFLFEPSFGVVDLAHNSVHALGSWDTAVTVTTPEDIGRLTAQIVLAEPAITNQVVYTAGDTLTYGQLADTVDTVLGITLKRAPWSVPSLLEALAQDPDDNLKKYRAVFAQGHGVAWDPAVTFNVQHGVAVTDVASWIRQHLTAPATSH